MKVFITGIAGFLGTHVAAHFSRHGHDVAGVDNLTRMELDRAGYNTDRVRRHNLDFLESVGAQCQVRDIQHLTVEEVGDTDLIIHCAAQPAMTISVEKPYLDFRTNVIGTVRMLRVAHTLKAAFVNCSSIHVYGNQSNQELAELPTRFSGQPTAEDSPILQGELSPLHASKRAAELYTTVFAETYGLRAATFRLTGMYGERQFAGMDHGWVANFAIRLLTDRQITIFDTPKQVRDILYASDAAVAFHDWYINGGRPTIYNIGGGQNNAISLGECLAILEAIAGKAANVTIGDARRSDLYYFVCDCAKAAHDFGWHPRISNGVGLLRLVSWIKDNPRLFTQ